MSWSNAYLGIPYADMGRDRSGCDCWGLARLVYAEELAISLPAYTEGYVSAEEQVEVASLIGSETRGPVWRKTLMPQPFDLLLFRHGRHESHVGIYVSPGVMLHMSTDDQSKHERLGHGRWGHRFVMAFEHEALRGVRR